MSSVVRTPPPTVNGRKIFLCGAADDVEDGVALLVACGDVEECQFIGTGRVVDGGLFDRIACITQFDEVHAFDDATVLHVEARDYAKFQHRALKQIIARRLWFFGCSARLRLGWVAPSSRQKASLVSSI